MVTVIRIGALIDSSMGPLMHSRRLLTSALVCALPLALAACDDKTPPDPRTQTPLVRTAIVQARCGIALVHRHRSRPGSKRPGLSRPWQGAGAPCRCRPDGQARSVAHAHRSGRPEVGGACAAGGRERGAGAGKADWRRRSALSRSAGHRCHFGLGVRPGEGRGGCRPGPTECGGSAGRGCAQFEPLFGTHRRCRRDRARDAGRAWPSRQRRAAGGAGGAGWAQGGRGAVA